MPAHHEVKITTGASRRLGCDQGPRAFACGGRHQARATAVVSAAFSVLMPERNRPSGTSKPCCRCRFFLPLPHGLSFLCAAFGPTSSQGETFGAIRRASDAWLAGDCASTSWASSAAGLRNHLSAGSQLAAGLCCTLISKTFPPSLNLKSRLRLKKAEGRVVSPDGWKEKRQKQFALNKNLSS